MTPSLHVRSASSESDWQAVKALRIAVFVDEQGLPAEVEFDDHDASAIARHRNRFARRGRRYRPPVLRLPRVAARIGRMAVRHDLRRCGIGAAVLDWLEACAVEQGVLEVVRSCPGVPRAVLRSQSGYVVDGRAVRRGRLGASAHDQDACGRREHD